MRGKHSAGGWVLEGVVWAAAALFSIQMFDEAKGGSEWSGLSALFGIVIVMGLSLILFPFRTGRRVIELANKERRMESATTYIKPGEYLSRNLWGLWLRASAPAILAPPFLLLSIDWRNRDVWDIWNAFEWLAISACFFWVVWLQWLGCVDWLARLCRRNRSGSMLLVPALWLVAAVAIPAGVSWLGLGLGLPAGIGLVAVAGVGCVNWLVLRWRGLCGDYYLFEK